MEHTGESRPRGVSGLVDQARSLLTVERVFGAPVEKDGVTVIPAASVKGGGGGGGGGGEDTKGGRGQGEGLGFGVQARPAGAFVIRDGNVRWEPAVDVTRIVLAANLSLIVFFLVFRSVAKRRGKRR